MSGSDWKGMVGASGFEPPTSWSRTRRSSQAEPRPENTSVIYRRSSHKRDTIESVPDALQLRDLPAVHEVLDRLSPSLARYPRALVVDEIRRALAAIRRE